MNDPSFDIVIPTLGRPELAALLRSLDTGPGPLPEHLWVVDDRRDRSRPLPLPRLSTALEERLRTRAGFAAGPASARNIGWRASRATWVVFLDDDVIVDPDWREALARDLAAVSREAAGSQGVVRVPLPVGRRPTDWERNVASLETARWITADMAYRRDVLQLVGGFDERFTRAYREDSDLALRILTWGFLIERGSRRVQHPVRPADFWISVRSQRGNGDDVLMDILHGADWYERAGAPRGLLRSHKRTTACALLAAICLLSGRRREAAVVAAVWLARTAVFGWRRIAPGPKTGREVLTMIATSTAIPFCSVFHRFIALARWRLLGARAL
ncbi:MAG TPA: glycosyltransferase [Candidatus Acidoferrales bacterium]|nr:glycosyltransferase [Candidatus Acidoferrales bacterium]